MEHESSVYSPLILRRLVAPGLNRTGVVLSIISLVIFLLIALAHQTVFASLTFTDIFFIQFLVILVVTSLGALLPGLLSASVASLVAVYLGLVTSHVPQVQIGFVVIIYLVEAVFISLIHATYHLHDDRTVRFAGILGQLNLPLIIADKKGKIVYWNEAAQRVYHYSSDEAGEKKIDLDRLEASAAEEAYQALPGDRYIDLHTTNDGKPVYVDLLTQSLSHNETLIIAYDVSAYKKRELKLEKQIKAREEFLSFASHELRTPLTSVLLQLESVLRSIYRDPLASLNIEKLLNLLKNAQYQSKKIADLIANLLDVSRLTHGTPTLNLEDVQLHNLVKMVVEGFEEEAKRHGSSISVTIQAETSGVWDRLQIEQVLTNLLSNAIKYGNKKPVTVTVGTKGECSMLVVRDRGIGIPKSALEDVFKPYKRFAIDPTHKGLGVGLYISHRIIEAHGGSISVESKPGSGTSFTVLLPPVPPPADVDVKA